MAQGDTFWVHPQVVSATVHLLGKAGARRIRLLESPTSSKFHSLEEFISQAGWQPSDFTRAASGVEFENTNFAGASKKYTRLYVPGGGLLINAYDLNRSYEDCDVFRLSRQAERAQHRRHDRGDEEPVRNYADHNLWRGCRRG